MYRHGLGGGWWEKRSPDLKLSCQKLQTFNCPRNTVQSAARQLGHWWIVKPFGNYPHFSSISGIFTRAVIIVPYGARHYRIFLTQFAGTEFIFLMFCHGCFASWKGFLHRTFAPCLLSPSPHAHALATKFWLGNPPDQHKIIKTLQARIGFHLFFSSRS